MLTSAIDIMASSKINSKPEVKNHYTDSINLDTVTSNVFGMYNGSNISGTTPFELAGGMGHIVLSVCDQSLIQQVIISPYAARMAIRTKIYSNNGFIWKPWNVITFS